MEEDVLDEDKNDRRDRSWRRAETAFDLLVATVAVAAAFVWILLF